MNQMRAMQPEFQQDPLMDEDSIDLRHYWRVLMRFKWGIAGLGLLSGIVTALVMLQAEDVYEARATLLFESNQPRIATIEDLYGMQTQSREYYSTQFELLKNRTLAERVIDELNLGDHPEFREQEGGFSLGGLIASIKTALLPGEEGPPPSEAEQQFKRRTALVNAFNQRLTISPVRNTNLAHVVFESTDPRLAADVANALSNGYIESYLEQRLASTQQASSWMTERLSGLKDALDASEARLQGFLEREGVVDIQGATALNVQVLDELTTQNNEARRRKAEAETIYQQIQQLRDASPQELLSVPAILNHQSMQLLRESRNDVDRQLADLSQRYGRRHPRMIALNSQRTEVIANMERQAQQLVSSIETEYQAAVVNERLTQQRLDEAKNEYQDVNRKNFELRELQREVDTNRQLYDTFFTRLRETNETEDFKATPAIIVDPAVPPLNPSKPRRSLITAIALLAGLMLGTMLAFLRDMLDNTIHTPADVEERLGATMLGLVPLAKGVKLEEGSRKQAYLGFVEDPHSSFAESFRTMRTSLMLSSIDKPWKLIAVTSSVPNEGKTTVALNLASVMAQMKKTLLIDADMRRPSLARSLGLDPHSPGLSNFMAGTAELKQCVYPFKDGNFAVMPGGQIVPNPLELLSSPKFTQMLERLGQTFEQIIIDTPPTQAVSDALVIGSIADAVIYVVKSDNTPINVVKNGLQRLTYANANIVGVTLNQVDTEKQGAYYYYGGYYDSYGYGYSDQPGGGKTKGRKKSATPTPA